DRIIKVSDLSLQTLLSSELIKKTDSPNVYEVNIDQAVILPKEALAAHVLSHAIDKPILLLTALPGFSETPIVDAIVYSKDQASPEFNV
ncbi:hypothetical protein, partial [Enterococcus faecium]|uniref:hypothetical protein n=1 Tax=Enterococcus faecium TaxID=1352 RepID=UPI003F425F8B